MVGYLDEMRVIKPGVNEQTVNTVIGFPSAHWTSVISVRSFFNGAAAVKSLLVRFSLSCVAVSVFVSRDRIRSIGELDGKIETAKASYEQAMRKLNIMTTEQERLSSLIHQAEIYFDLSEKTDLTDMEQAQADGQPAEYAEQRYRRQSRP